MQFLWRSTLTSLLALLSFQSLSESAFRAADPDLQACAKRNALVRTISQRQHVRVISEQGWTRESTRLVYIKRGEDDALNVLFEVETPQTEAGMKVLITKKTAGKPVAWVYLPELGRARRVVGNGAGNSVLGTDFSYEDMLYFECFLNAKNVQKSEIEHEGRAAWLLETAPHAKSSAYRKIDLILDQQTCLPLGAKFWKHNGDLAKSMIVNIEAIKRVDDHDVLDFITMQDHIRGSKTEIRVEDVAFNPALRAGMFSPSEIKYGR
ncbi:MAG: outer membrane lipoprotein-sorting protein [Pseudomonadota bacterium]